MIAAILQDIRYAVRMLLKKPGFTAVAVVTLALGIGANTAIFTLVNSVLLRPLPYPDPERLVMIWGAHPQIGREAASLPDFVDWRQQSRSFEYMAAAARRNFNLSGDAEPTRLLGALVTREFFAVLGIQPILGRTFMAEEDRPGGARVVILSEPLWRRRFDADENAVGRSLRLNGESYTIVGVAPARLKLPTDTELWVPLARDPAQSGRRNDFLAVVARLKPGANITQAQAELRAIMARLERAYPNTNAGWSADVIPLHEQIVADIRLVLLVLTGAVGFVLLIACANVANLLLSRAAARQREIAVRTALGAPRSRLVRQLLTESVLLAIVGGAAGLLLAYWSIEFLVQLQPQKLPRLAEIDLDSRVLGFALLSSVVTGLIFGLAPAFQISRSAAAESLKEGAHRATSGLARSYLRSSLVVAEVALSLVLLVGAGLMIRSLYSLLDLDLGFDRDNLLTVQIPLPQSSYPENQQVFAFQDRLLERVRALPGVTEATLVSPLPLSGGSIMWSFAIEGRSLPPPEQVQDASVLIVGDQYVETMKIPLLQGRSFRATDREKVPGALINQTFARRYFQMENPLGHRLTFGDPQNPQARWLTIVGIVADVKHQTVEEQIYPTVYVPNRGQDSNMALVVRTKSEPLNLAAAVRTEVRSLDKDLPVYAVRTMEQVLASALEQRRFSVLVLTIFAMVALALSAIGIYGVVAYSVTQRTHEIGIRMSLGARPLDVLKMVLEHGMKLGFAGVLLGLLGALALTGVLSKLLFGISTTDPITFLSISLLPIAVALLASYLPARRATKVDPIVALRYE